MIVEELVMKCLPLLSCLALFASVCLAADPVTPPIAVAPSSHPFTAQDLVMLDRVSDPQLAPDGKRIAFQLRQTDLAANRGIHGIWLLDLAAPGRTPQRLTETTVDASNPRWSADGVWVYFLARHGDSTGLWRRRAEGKDAAMPVTDLPLDINNYKLSPDGQHVLLSIDVFPDCAREDDPLICTHRRLEATTANKASGRLYEQLFVRHWDAWSDGRRSQLFITAIGADGKVAPLRWLSQGIDGDIPSKPFGDDAEYAFAPDGKTVYFDVRIAGRNEPWSTNFDIYAVPSDGSMPPRNLTAANPAWDAIPVPSADGKTLYYLAMRRPGFEADRFAVMALDLASGRSRELDPTWDRSASGLQASKDGKVLYTTADDAGDHALFAIDVARGTVRRLTAAGQVQEFNVRGDRIVYARSDLKTPADLFQLDPAAGIVKRLTALNAERLAALRMGDYEFFTFRGAGGEAVQGYVVKPVDFVFGQKYPVAFLIHGGPQGAMTNEFHYRWNPQTYAGQGFAVVTINFHGSTGYGQRFTDSISGDWGGKPLQDLQLGWAAALEKYPFLDGDHACALGASYGGYMIYWIAGNWPQPWKCLVAHDGVFDTRIMGYATEELWFSSWENGGSPWQHPENYEKFNPLNHVADWRVPMLVIHSEKDFRIPLEQGLAAFTALQWRGIPSEFLTFPDENHWVLKPQNSLLWHDTINRWLRRWTAP
jgi:dipeptidyl aminopeptidase/acylaminoacyl peptidase